MNKHKEILKFIKLLNKTFKKYPECSGGCYKFHLILKTVFGGEPYGTNDHVITKIDNKFYDWSGEVKKTDEFLEEFKLGEDYFNKVYKTYL